jgi:hypothetical protein
VDRWRFLGGSDIHWRQDSRARTAASRGVWCAIVIIGLAWRVL